MAPSRGFVKLRTSALICLACIVEGADMAVLPAVYLFIARSLRASPSELGVMTLCRALMQALSSPISGVLGDTIDRTIIVAAGALIWSACTVGVSMSTHLVQACVFTTMNGLGLALVIPCAQSLMADYYPAEQRGRAFGAMQLTMSCGSMVGSLFATNVSKYKPWGMDGWRFAMRCVSLVSLTVAVGIALLAADPRGSTAAARTTSGPLSHTAPVDEEPLPQSSVSAASQHGRSRYAVDGGRGGRPPLAPNGVLPTAVASAAANGNAPGAGTARGGRKSFMRSLRAAMDSVVEISSLRTFQIIIAQGIVGTMPWNAIAFLTLWLQLLGFSDWHASVLSAAFYGACSAGAFLGGFVGDRAARCAPNSGRITTAQISAVSGIPLTLLLVLGLPTASISDHFALYCTVIVAFGILTPWCGPGCNSPIFAEIVPASKRSLIYAFDRCFEGALAACAAPLVGAIAEHVFGYDSARAAAAATDAAGADAGNAEALGRSLVCCLCVPWALCFLIYFGLYFTYPHDRSQQKLLPQEQQPLRGWQTQP
eukprot:jgi/Ulvmu1/852/UM100_0003.1